MIQNKSWYKDLINHAALFFIIAVTSFDLQVAVLENIFHLS